MREIKFRAWDVKRGEMRGGIDNLMLDLAGNLYWQFGYREPEMLDRDSRENFVVMQYIGFKDENGIEIYEGDVVEYEFDGHLCRGAIIYNKNGFWLKNGYIPYECKVIGNIHENPGILLDRNIPKASNS